MIWQRGFHDHIIRDRRDYEKIAKYIYENPIRWQYDCFFAEEISYIKPRKKLSVEGVTMPVVDSLGEEFLNYVKDGMMITVKADGVVEVDG